MAQVNYNEPSRPPADRGGDGHAGIYAVLIIVVLLILAAVLYFGGVFGPAGEQGTDLEIDIDQPADVIQVPEVDAPDIDINAPNIDIPDTVNIQ